MPSSLDDEERERRRQERLNAIVQRSSTSKVRFFFGDKPASGQICLRSFSESDVRERERERERIDSFEETDDNGVFCIDTFDESMYGLTCRISTFV